MGRASPELAVALALASCAASEPTQENAALTSFLCEGGYYFWAEERDAEVRIITSAGTFVLAERPSSIGRKFSSDSATFIRDEDRAALNGLPGGPFRRCHEVIGEDPTSLPPLPETIEIESSPDETAPMMENVNDEPA
jgi:hypothetical protein